MMIDSYHDAVNYLKYLIPKGTAKKYPAQRGLKRTKYLLSLLAHPQNSFTSVHITGTSGKGSTSNFIAQIARQAGFRVGLFTSPHLVTIRERIKINNHIITKTEFVKLVKTLQLIVNKVSQTPLGSPTYFEILTAIAFLAFKNHHIDIGVIEVGMGGRYDSTNVFNSSTAIITNIGLDHTHILGKTPQQIIKDKMRIVKKNATVITAIRQPSILAILQNYANKKNSHLIHIAKLKNPKDKPKDSTLYHIELANDQKLILSITTPKNTYENITLQALGTYQAENAACALTAIEALEKKGYHFSKKAIYQGFFDTKIKGRMTIHSRRPLIILDGAHNRDKIRALVRSLRFIYPHQRFTIIFAVKRTKDAQGMVKELIPLAKSFILTEFFKQTNFGKHMAKPTSDLAHILRTLAFKGKVIIVPQSDQALTIAKKEAKKEGNILITGSLYLLGEIFAKALI